MSTVNQQGAKINALSRWIYSEAIEYQLTCELAGDVLGLFGLLLCELKEVDCETTDGELDWVYNARGVLHPLGDLTRHQTDVLITFAQKSVALLQLPELLLEPGGCLPPAQTAELVEAYAARATSSAAIAEFLATQR